MVESKKSRIFVIQKGKRKAPPLSLSQVTSGAKFFNSATKVAKVF